MTTPKTDTVSRHSAASSCGRVTPKGTHPPARRRPAHGCRVHYRLASRLTPRGFVVDDDQVVARCACGLAKIGTPTDVDEWFELHRVGRTTPPIKHIWLAWAAYLVRVLVLGRWHDVRFAREAHEGITLVNAHAHLHDPISVRRPDLQRSARAMVRAGGHVRRTAALGIDYAGACRRAPREYSFTNADGETIDLIRTRRDGRPGFVSLSPGRTYRRFYPNITGASGLTRYWVGGSGTWDSSTTTNWSAADGGAGGASAPDAGDDAKVTANSGGGTITMATTARCRSWDCTGAPATTVAWGSGGILAVGDGSGGAVKLVNNISFTGSASGAINLVSTSNNGGTGWGITTAGKTFPMLTCNGVGGKWVLQDNLTSNANGEGLTVTNGGFFGNGKTLAIAILSSSGTATRTIDLTSCTVTLNQGGLATVHSLNSTGLTWVAPTTLTVTTGSSTTFQGGGLTYNSVSFTSTGAPVLQGANTFTNLTRTGTAAKTEQFNIQANQTVTGTLTLGGNTTSGVNRLLVFSNTRGTARTFTLTGAAVVIGGDVDFMDITISGSPSWSNAASFVGDCGGNSGITATVAATQTATGTASFTWSTHGWTSRVPLPQDTVSIPNAFVAGRTITVDMPRLGGDISFAGGSGSPTLTNSVVNESYGSLTFVTGVTPSGTNTWTLAGRGVHTITSAGASFTQAVTIAGPGGSYTLQDAFAAPTDGAAGVLTVDRGTFVSNNQSVNIGQIVVSNNANAGVTMGTSTWTLQRTGAVSPWNVQGSAPTISAASGTIVIGSTSTSTRSFVGASQTYGTISYTVAGSTGQLTVTGSNSFNAINFSDASNARTLAFTNGTTTTITSLNGFNVQGTSGKLMSIASTSAGNAFTLTSSFNQSVQYVSVKDSTAAGTGNWVDFDGTNVSGNTNWFFNAVPVAVIAGTGTFFTPSTAQVGLPSFVAGIGTVLAPTPIAKALVPSFVDGQGAVQTPTTPEAPTPAAIVGTGTFFTPTGVEIAKPSFIAGTGTVQSPSPTDLSTPALISGIGSFFTPTELEVVLPSFIAGTGTVQSVTPMVPPAPSFIDGQGSFITPDTLEVVSPSFIAGTGTVFTPTELDKPTPAAIVGTGTFFTPTGVEIAKPSFIAGIGTVFFGALAVPQLTIAGTGTVMSGEVEVKPTPSFIVGTGTFFTPTGPETALLSPVQGVGTVQPLSVIATARPAMIAGTGSVFTPLIPVRLSFIAGVGTVQPVGALVPARPAYVLGIGTIQMPQSIALIWAGISITISITKREQTLKVSDRSMTIAVKERGDTVEVSEALGIRGNQ